MFKKTRVRQIIELLQKKLSDREISGVLGVSRNSVARIRQDSDECRKEWDELLMMSDDELYHFFYPDKFKSKSSYATVDYAYVHRELSKVGVTGVLLWEEYCEKCKNEVEKACSYPTFARGYKRYTVSRNYTSHVEHKPSVALEVDWSGPTMGYIDPDKNTECTAYLFVATFPYSQYTYVEAAASMNQSDWMYCNVHMLEFFEGSPVKIICNNLKTGVITHPKHGEIVLNDAYLSRLPAGIYGEEMLEEACRKALKDFHTVTYNTLIPYIKEISKGRKNETKSTVASKRDNNQQFRIVSISLLRCFLITVGFFLILCPLQFEYRYKCSNLHY